MRAQTRITLAVATLVLAVGMPAMADNVHINCISTCFALAGSQGTKSFNPSFTITNMGTSGLITSSGKGKNIIKFPASGTMFLVVLAPGNSTLTFKANGVASGAVTSFTSPSKFLFPTLGMPGGNPANLQAFTSITQAVLPSFTSSVGYKVSTISLGAYNFTKNGGPISVSFSSFLNGTKPSKGFAAGTLFFAYLIDNNQHGLIVDQTPFSEVLGITQGPPAPTPEPSSLVLMGSGLITLAGFVRRKLVRD